MADFGIVIHGGAGAISKLNMTPKLEKAYRAGLADSLTAGYKILKAGGCSLEAVQRAVNVMEDSPLFNAGRGAVFTNAGTNEMDAAIMDGSHLGAGAVAGVRHIKNPINLARLVMEKSNHVLLAREGAEEFARSQGVEQVPDSYFFTELRWKQLQSALARESGREKTELSEGNPDEDRKFGTVGAVALDKSGNLAAATSTGGMTNCRYGRIGDSPIIGAGTCANNLTCAVSTTGHGEFFMRAVTAFSVSALMEHGGMNLKQAAEAAIFERLTKLGGTGGLIAIDASGNIALPFNTPGMYRGYYLSGGEPWTAIYRD
ncbi:isoaspartyl dipeptidase with L-asparaginase activity [Candidatus Zixiibacteriota bacterium]|nr:isoaspartyl dipeptidase with L-asparaginase activity [candidate division Zixibacteria bacterium]